MKNSKLFAFSIFCTYFQFAEAAPFSRNAGNWRLKEIEIPTAVIASQPTDDFTLTDTESSISNLGTYDAIINDPIVELQSGNILLIGPMLQQIGFLPNNQTNLTTFYLSIGGDLLAHVISDATSHILALAVKEPNAVTLAELEGNWVSHFIETPRTVIAGQLSLPFDTARESVSVDSSGLANGGAAGSFTTSNGNRLQFTSEGETETFFANAAKDVLITTNEFTAGLSLAILTKTPDSLAVADLAGIWQVLSISVPNVTNFLGLNANNSDFEGESATLSINALGEIANSEQSAVAINQDNTLTFTDSDNTTTIFSINQSKNFMVSSFFETAQITFQIAVRLKTEPTRSRILLADPGNNGAPTLQALDSGALELLRSNDLKQWSLMPVDVDGPFIIEVDNPSEPVFYQSVQ